MKKGTFLLMLTMLVQVFSTATVFGMEQKKKKGVLTPVASKKTKNQQKKTMGLTEFNQITPITEDKKKEEQQQESTIVQEQERIEDTQSLQEDQAPTKEKEEKISEPEAAEWSDQEDIDQNDNEPTAYTVPQLTKNSIGLFSGSDEKGTNYFRNADYILAHQKDISGRQDLQGLYKDAFTQAMSELISQIRANKEAGLKADYLEASRLLKINKHLITKLVAVKMVAKEKGIPTKEMNALAHETLKLHTGFKKYAKAQAQDFFDENGASDDETSSVFGANYPKAMLIPIKRAATTAYKGNDLGKKNRQLVTDMLYKLIADIEQGKIDIETMQSYIKVIQRKKITLDPEVVQWLDVALVNALKSNETSTLEFASEKNKLHQSMISLREEVSNYANRYADKSNILAQTPETKFMGSIEGLVMVPENKEN